MTRAVLTNPYVWLAAGLLIGLGLSHL